MMRNLNRLAALILSLLMLFAAVPAQAENIKIGPLTDGIPFTDALTIVCAIAQNAGCTVDFDTLKYNEKNQTCTVKAGVFTLHVQADGNANACSAGISASYLDGEYARQMGTIFGAMLSNLSDIDSLDALSGLDFNVFNTLKASQQTLIFGDYKISMVVDPDSPTPYSFTLALKTPVPVEASTAASIEDARLILGRMNIDVSAAFLYDESTDLNGKLGKEGSYYSKINFARTALAPNATVSASLSVDQGGSIEVFATHEQAVERSNYITSKLRLTGSKEHHFAYGNALLRLSSTTSPEDVGKLITAFIIAVNGDFAPSAAPAATATSVPSVKKGDKVTFGSYEQDNNTANGKEPIQWLVADVQNGEALLVSVYALDVYNTYWGAPTWDKSTLRTWMNGTFYNAAFSASEKNVILTSTVKADKHPYYTSDPGSTTQDKVFCLSYVEADSLLTAAQRKCEPTTYAKRVGKVYTEGKYCYWWLRTPGRPGCGAAIVCTDSSYDYDASYDGFCYGARPCIRIPANSPMLKK